jgi:hypothetical protein
LDSPGAGCGFLKPIVVFGVMGFERALRDASQKKYLRRRSAST